METRTLEAIVREGGVVRLEGLPFTEGKRIEVTLKEKEPEMTQEEWIARLRESYGALANTSFEVPQDYPPSEIEPLQ